MKPTVTTELLHYKWFPSAHDCIQPHVDGKLRLSMTMWINTEWHNFSYWWPTRRQYLVVKWYFHFNLRLYVPCTWMQPRKPILCLNPKFSQYRFLGRDWALQGDNLHPNVGQFNLTHGTDDLDTCSKYQCSAHKHVCTCAHPPPVMI